MRACFSIDGVIAAKHTELILQQKNSVSHFEKKKYTLKHEFRLKEVTIIYRFVALKDTGTLKNLTLFLSKVATRPLSFGHPT